MEENDRDECLAQQRRIVDEAAKLVEASRALCRDAREAIEKSRVRLDCEPAAKKN